MFLITVTYKKPLEIVDKFLNDHRAFLEEGYKKDYFIVSGPKNPRTGGIIFSQLKDLDQLNLIIQQDPFFIHDVADFEIVEFIPVKFHPKFAQFIT